MLINSTAMYNEEIPSFAFSGLPTKVIFSQNSLVAIKKEIEERDFKRLMIVTTRSQANLAQNIALALDENCVGIFSEAKIHTPLNVSLEALAMFRNLDCDSVLSVGGGSAIGLGKALGYRTSAPLLGLPTTYAGSEMTSIFGETNKKLKITLSDERAQFRAVIYDPQLSLSLPSHVSMCSGLNALAHAIESLYGVNKNSMTNAIASEAIKLLVEALPKIKKNPLDLISRTMAMQGAWLAGSCLSVVGMGLHHSLCHVLGGAFDLPHAETHAVILPHVVRYNLSHLPSHLQTFLFKYPGNTIADQFQAFTLTLETPTSLRELGLPKSAINQAAKLTLERKYWNPQFYDEETIESLLVSAWNGALSFKRGV